MSAPLYAAKTEADVAVSTVRTVLGVKAHANSGLLLKKLHISLDGVSASGVPGLIELGYCTFATNSPGTNSTSTTPVQQSGRVLTAGFTSGRNWTSEPTTITVLDEWRLTPNGGLVLYDLPLGDEYDTALGEGLVVRATFAASVNFRGTMIVCRC